MTTIIGNPVHQPHPYTSQNTTPKKTSEKATSQSEQGTKSTETRTGKVDSGSEKTDTVEITNSRFLVSEANRAASETEIEDIDQAVEKIQELKRWLEAEQESDQLEQIHRLNGEILLGVLSYS